MIWLLAPWHFHTPVNMIQSVSMAAPELAIAASPHISPLIQLISSPVHPLAAIYRGLAAQKLTVKKRCLTVKAG